MKPPASSVSRPCQEFPVVIGKVTSPAPKSQFAQRRQGPVLPGLSRQCLAGRAKALQKDEPVCWRFSLDRVKARCGRVAARTRRKITKEKENYDEIEPRAEFRWRETLSGDRVGNLLRRNLFPRKFSSGRFSRQGQV